MRTDPCEPVTSCARPSQFLYDLLRSITPFSSSLQALRWLDERSQDRAFIISFVNQHAINLATHDARFRACLMESDLLLRDGAGVELACRAFGIDPGQNLNGTDFIPLVLEHVKGQKVLLCGTTEPWLSAAAQALESQGHRVVGTLNGFQPFQAYVQKIRARRPDVIILGMGMPRQETLAQSIARNISFPALIINGGAILDFLGQRVTRAPLWMRRLRLEWLYQLSLEPVRLSRRYLIGIPVFIYKVVVARYKIRSAA